MYTVYIWIICNQYIIRHLVKCNRKFNKNNFNFSDFFRNTVTLYPIQSNINDIKPEIYKSRITQLVSGKIQWQN